jgi:hypothetical protein
MRRELSTTAYRAKKNEARIPSQHLLPAMTMAKVL